MSKIAVVLAGCGFLDGAEIHESVTTLLNLSKNGAAALCYAPNIQQKTVTNHFTRDAANETRNVLVEASRIARGEIKPLSELKVDDADAVIFPGGFGAALNLCDFAQNGENCTVEPQVERVIREFHAAKKPQGFICIAPSFAAKVLGAHQVELTIGSDTATAQKLEKMGAKHVNKKVDEIHVDEKNLVVSTPAYMLASTIAEVDAGVSKLVQQVLRWSR